jgi:signal transduction histidine kinase
MTGMRTAKGMTLRGAPPDAVARAASARHREAPAREGDSIRGDAPRVALGILAESALAAAGADFAVAALIAASDDGATEKTPGAGRLLRAQAGRGFVLPDEAVERTHDHLHRSSTGWWTGRRLTELMSRDGRPATAAAGVLIAVRLKLGGRSGVLLAVHRSPIPDVQAAVASLARVATLAPRVTDSLHAVVHHERHMLGQALHDTLAQTLTELVFATDALACDTGAPRKGDLIGRTQNLVARALRETRTVLSSALALEDYPFPASIATLVVDLRAAGIDVRLHGAADLDVLPPQVDRCLRYAAREALVNIRRHAQADRVDVTLASHGGRVLLTVTDNGSGSSGRPPRSARPWGGLGLCLLRELVGELGGSLDLAAAPDRGTCLTVALPIPADAGRCDV